IAPDRGTLPRPALPWAKSVAFAQSSATCGGGARPVPARMCLSPESQPLGEEGVGERPILRFLGVRGAGAVAAFGRLVEEHLVALRLHLGSHHACKHRRDPIVRGLGDEEDGWVSDVALYVLKRR